jgi:predicted O-methyltransferase YrrM
MPSFLDKGFSGQWPQDWAKWLEHLKGKPARGLEVGCFDGRATLWFLENILTHPASRMYVVDTFEGGEDHQAAGINCVGLRARFEANLAAHTDRLNISQMRSADYLCKIGGEDLREFFDFIYIDGSHIAADVLADSVLAWPLLQPGGVMFWDDYQWHKTPDTGPNHEPAMAIDAFLACYEGHYRLIHKAYQVCAEKVS